MINPFFCLNKPLKAAFLAGLMLFSFLGKAQEPSYFKIGKKELSGVNVYDIFHDEAGDYWIATNNGLYKYDCFEFKKIPIENKKGNSVFSFKTNSKGELFCHNFAGQIFRVENDSARVYYEVENEDLSKNFQFEFTTNDELLIASETVMIVDSEYIVKRLFEDRSETKQIFSFLAESYIMFMDAKLFSVYQLKNGKIELVYQGPKQFKNAVTYLVCDDNVIFYDPHSGEFLSTLMEDVDSLELTWGLAKTRSGQVFAGQNDIWVLNGLGGFYGLSNSKELYFESTTLSCFYEDREGNKLIGTFGDGVLVIPNMKVQNIEVESYDKKVSKICTDGKDLFVGTNKGEVFRVNEKGAELIFNQDESQIEFLDYLPSSKSLVFNSVEALVYDLGTNKYKFIAIGSGKSMSQISMSEYVFSSGGGLFTYNTRIDHHSARYGDLYIECEPVKNFKIRGYSVDYDRQNEVFYAGTVNGLKIGNEDSAWFYKHKGENVICYDIKAANNEVYVATNGHGILIFKNQKLIEEWNVESGLPSNFIKQIDIINGKIYGTSEKGFFEANSRGKILRTLTIADGLNSNNIADFEIIGDQLWLISNNRLQKIPLNSIEKKNFKPELNYLNVFQNEELIKEGIQFDLKTRFKFEFASKTLRHKEDISYRYQLIGIDDDWVEVGYQTRKAEYKSLPAGKYEFQAQVRYEDFYSTPSVFSFEVFNPFWLRTWFLVLCAFMFVSIVLVVYFIQRKRFRLKVEIKQNLAKSQLSTLKSQMNPHFIFNSLSSVQDLILQEKKEGAYKYISKFAMLVRKTLNQSDQEFIEFEEEVSLLSIYLELEQLRFKKDFSYHINAEGIEDIEIPPMLIQPIVENAIKHGLLHKKGQKTLEISYSLKDSIIICHVKDNGIGRKRAIEIKSRQKQQNESFALSSIEARFELLKSIYGGDLGIQYIDHEVDGNSAGTEVIIKVPYRNNY